MLVLALEQEVALAVGRVGGAGARAGAGAAVGVVSSSSRRKRRRRRRRSSSRDNDGFQRPRSIGRKQNISAILRVELYGVCQFMCQSQGTVMRKLV